MKRAMTIILVLAEIVAYVVFGMWALLGNGKYE